MRKVKDAWGPYPVSVFSCVRVHRGWSDVLVQLLERDTKHRRSSCGRFPDLRFASLQMTETMPQFNTMYYICFFVGIPELPSLARRYHHLSPHVCIETVAVENTLAHAHANCLLFSTRGIELYKFRTYNVLGCMVGETSVPVCSNSVILSRPSNILPYLPPSAPLPFCVCKTHLRSG